jgi:hypothetical protein
MINQAPVTRHQQSLLWRSTEIKGEFRCLSDQKISSVEMNSNVAASQKDMDIPKDLECSICGDIFDKAVSLKACGHTFCSICIRNHWVTTSRPGIHHQSKKECPLCRSVVGSDVNRALVVNREIQQAVKAFKPASLSPPSAKIGCPKFEAPIEKRFQSRNYAGMQKNGKKELQNVCKEYNLPLAGNEQELVDRLRCFECMWNAELDTIDTPLRPSEVVAKFKKKERMQREEKSRDVMTGKIHHTKYMKKLTSSLLDDENRRNDLTVSATSSGNSVFDAKLKSNFSALIAEGRRRMKKESSWSSPCKSVGIRTYDDDCIHDSTKRNGSINCGNESSVETTDPNGTTCNVEQTPDDESAKVESPVDKQLPQKNQTFNPYQSERKRKFQNSSVHAKRKYTQRSRVIGRHTPNTPTVTMTTLAELTPSPSPDEGTIHNPYKKKQLQHRRTPSPFSVSSCHATRGDFESAALPTNSEQKMRELPSGDKEVRDRIPLVQANDINRTASVHRRQSDDAKNLVIRSINVNPSTSNGAGISTKIPTQKKNIIHNPYKSNRYRHHR